MRFVSSLAENLALHQAHLVQMRERFETQYKIALKVLDKYTVDNEPFSSFEELRESQFFDWRVGTEKLMELVEKEAENVIREENKIDYLEGEEAERYIFCLMKDKQQLKKENNKNGKNVLK